VLRSLDLDHIRSRVRPSQISALLTCFLLLLGCFQAEPTPSVERTTTLVLSLLHDESAEVRRTAVESLGKIGEQSVVASIVPLLADRVPVVRVTAAKALGRIGAVSNGTVIAALIRALEDPDDEVKQAAAMAIGELEPSSSQLKPVASLVRASDVRVRRAAVRALLDLSVVAAHLAGIGGSRCRGETGRNGGAVNVGQFSGANTNTQAIGTRFVTCSACRSCLSPGGNGRFRDEIGTSRSVEEGSGPRGPAVDRGRT
jgi:HEAT repeats